MTRGEDHDGLTLGRHAASPTGREAAHAAAEEVSVKRAPRRAWQVEPVSVISGMAAFLSACRMTTDRGVAPLREHAGLSRVSNVEHRRPK